MYGRPNSSSGSDDDCDSSSDYRSSGGLPSLMTMDTIGTSWKHESSTSSSTFSSLLKSISDNSNTDMILNSIRSDDVSEETSDGYRRSKRIKLKTQSLGANSLYKKTRDHAAIPNRDVPAAVPIHGVPAAFFIRDVPAAVPIHDVPAAFFIRDIPAAVPIPNVPHTIRDYIDTDSDSDSDTDANSLYETDFYNQTDAYVHSEMDTDTNVHYGIDNVSDVPEADNDINAKSILRQQLSLPNTQHETDNVGDVPEADDDINTKSILRQQLSLPNIHHETDNVGDVPGADDDINAKSILRQKLSLPNNYESNEEVNPQPSSATDSETIFQKEIIDKDPNDPTYGDGFEIERMFGPMLTRGEMYYHLQWRKGIYSGVGLLEATTIYKKWPKVALTFYENHF